MLKHAPKWRPFYQDSPYRGFPHENHPLDLQGWNSDHAIFRDLVTKTMPTIIIEVGTWKGASAVNMANIAKELGLFPTLICVDTWFGGPGFWSKENDALRSEALHLKFGQPQIYQQFIANVIKSGHTDIIVPLPTTSVTGSRILKNRGVTADLIYIDASHEYLDVLWDIENYLPLLTPHGVIFGDDYVDLWPGVKQAVQEYTAKHDLTFDVVGNNFWVIKR